MERQKKFYQLKSKKLWKDSIAIGLSIFGVASAVSGVFGVSFAVVISNVWLVILATIGSLILCYVIAVIYQWVKIKDSITLKIRGIKITLKQGDIFLENGLKVIGVDEAFTVDDTVISPNSLHGKLIKKLKDNNEIEEFNTSLSADSRQVSLGAVKTYKDFILLVLTKLDQDNEAHTDNQKYENTLRTMWQEIGRVYNERPILLPIIGDGIIRFDGVSEKPSPTSLLRCMLCTLKNSNVQIKAPITIVIYDRINEINLYDLKGV